MGAAAAGRLEKLGRGDRIMVRNGKQYWEGEWICADCGYIYNERSFGMKFEDLQQGFKCPQCAAPRRRFARKLGDKIGTTLDGGDTPIIIFTAVCLLIVLGIAYYSLQ
ncbi:rub [Symbiodinium sp. KB8]|nr:rub [Symbiodinium sp. KB8]